MVMKFQARTLRVFVFFGLICGVAIGAHPLESIVDANAAFFANANIEFRTFDGSRNNLTHPDWGQAGTPQARFQVNSYQDGQQKPWPLNQGDSPLNPRHLSVQVCKEPTVIFAEGGVSDFVWLWGQFVDHDVVLTPTDSKDPFPIYVPKGDPAFDPNSTGTVKIPLSRSKHAVIAGVRHPINDITAFVDGSNVYGSSEERAEALREPGTGRLKTTVSKTGDLLPLNFNKLPNEPESNPSIRKESMFLAGDVRSNEQISLTAMHTLFVREHNSIVEALNKVLVQRGYQVTPERLYQLARMVVGAELQLITYRDFLGIILGPGVVAQSPDYRSNVNPIIRTFFSTAAFRFGHSMVTPEFTQRNAHGQVIESLALRDVFFDKVPPLLVKQGLEPTFMGLAASRARRLDLFVVEDLRDFLFGLPGPQLPEFIAALIPKGLDLAAINIQRGRDHGLPYYNQARELYRLPPVHSFEEINPDPYVVARLRQAYATPNDIDAWVGGLAEAHLPNAQVGPLFHEAIRDQFSRLQYGDRFWYRRYLPPFLVEWVESQTLSKIITRNTHITNQLQHDVFRVRSY